eukprot:360102-Chlamydomonas_euryale.AAC.13
MTSSFYPSFIDLSTGRRWEEVVREVPRSTDLSVRSGYSMIVTPTVAREVRSRGGGAYSVCYLGEGLKFGNEFRDDEVWMCLEKPVCQKQLQRQYVYEYCMFVEGDVLRCGSDASGKDSVTVFGGAQLWAPLSDALL